MSGISLPPHWTDDPAAAPAVEAFICGDPLDRDDLEALRAYLRGWIASPWLDLTGDLTRLRLDVAVIATKDGLRDWLRRARLNGVVDPL